MPNTHTFTGDPTHDLHVWSLDGESHIMTIHVVLDEGAEIPVIRNRINLISKEHNITHTTVEFETGTFNCDMNCDIR